MCRFASFESKFIKGSGIGRVDATPGNSRAPSLTVSSGPTPGVSPRGKHALGGVLGYYPFFKLMHYVCRERTNSEGGVELQKR